ncbi:hypothetical protein MHH92_27435 [Paenibacillus sp. FSL M7-1414]|uniref:hypothetical protein n=1 Tax=Paenibacillus sp. FSL M7-1414 TaxID=2921542 RepID=UPI0030F5C59A
MYTKSRDRKLELSFDGSKVSESLELSRMVWSEGVKYVENASAAEATEPPNRPCGNNENTMVTNMIQTNGRFFCCIKYHLSSF